MAAAWSGQALGISRRAVKLSAYPFSLGVASGGDGTAEPKNLAETLALLTGVFVRHDATGTEMLVFSGATTRNGRLDVSPDGTLVAAPSDGNTVGIWSIETGTLVGSADGHTSPVTSAHFSSDGTMLVTGSGDTTVRTWSVAQA